MKKYGARAINLGFMRVVLDYSVQHLAPELHPLHAPKPWPHRWQPLAFTLTRTNVAPPSTAYRLWVYLKAGGAFYLGVAFRRKETRNYFQIMMDDMNAKRDAEMLAITKRIDAARKRMGVK